jgi:Protein kinase domain/GAF domain
VIHRDIKPSNIRLLEGNAIKIMDFGIAKAQNEVSDITKKGVAVGSAGYMSPEQICGDPVDHRTDIFSFGLLAYELLTGTKAFQSDNLFKLLENVVKEEPTPLEELAPDTPPDLAAIVRKALRKDPADRFATARELRDALVAVHVILPEPPAPVSLLPADEDARRRALARFEVLDTEPEQEFDDLARLAASVAGTPFALVSFVDGDRQWFKSRIGVQTTETPREHAICAHTILDSGPLVVRDLAADPRFADNPFVVGEPRIRFYAGAPIVTPDGHGIGTVCVLDRLPREVTADQLEALQALARQATSLLELRRRIRQDRGRSGEALIREASGGGAAEKKK